jgi:hypothetical protein
MTKEAHSMWNYTSLIVRLNSNNMRIVLKQENGDVYQWVRTALRSQEKTLTRVCKEMNIGYISTYKKLNAAFVDYEWLCEFCSEALPGEEVILNIEK